MYVVIIAGGRGERFWPKSTRELPKQFHTIVTERTMLQETFYRVYPEFGADRIFIVAPLQLREIILQQLPGFKKENLIIEPEGKNTAPAIGLATVCIHKKDPDATIAVLSADHVVQPKENFLKALENAGTVAGRGYIVTFGIQPARPATEFGYIETGGVIDRRYNFAVRKVRGFREKPSLETARDFVRRGTFLWNSGMFIFRADVLLSAIERHMPGMYRGLIRVGHSVGTAQEEKVKRDAYAGFESISIDYGVMEKAESIACIQPDFKWDDVGSWGALARHCDTDGAGNVVRGNTVLLDAQSNIIVGDDDTLIALIGIRDAVVVKEKNRVLICNRSMDQRIREVLAEIAEREDGIQYL